MLKNLLTALLGCAAGVLLYHTVKDANACSCEAAHLTISLESVEGEGATAEETTTMENLCSGTKNLQHDWDDAAAETLCITSGGSK